MTESVSGPALPQAHAHHGGSHSNLQSHTHHGRRRHLSHQQDSIRSSADHGHLPHQRDDASDPVVIVETVSILQIIDSSGATVNVQTVSSDNPDSSTQSLIQTTFADPTTSPASPQPTSNDGAYPSEPTLSSGGTSSGSQETSSDYDTAPQPTGSSSSTTATDPTVTPPESSMPSSFPTLSYSPVTSSHLSPPHGFPSHSGVTNSSQTQSTTFVSENTSTTTLLSYTVTVSNGTTLTIPLSTGTESSSTDFPTSTDTSSSSRSTFTSSSTSSTSSHSSASSTSGTTSSAYPPVETEPVAGTSTPTAGSGGQSSDDSDGPTTAVVAGSVVGAVAGIAFLLLAALYLLKWKKRQDALKAIGGGAAGANRSLTGGGPTGPSGGAGADMSEQSHSGAFAVPAALAALAGYKRNSRPRSSTGGAEGGFQKVSGRKLPSVLTSGGDGYTDPRENRDTMMSDESNSTSYRGSMAFFGGAQQSPRFAVGSPMRPESGIPVFHTGPARTPVTDQGPFSDYGPYRDDSPTLEPPRRDPLGRSHPSHDGSSRSHMSGSRFYEDL